ncbi:hypothetical protein AXZ77_3639 [Thioclava sp. ES.031]|uniref:hypothetical protein n=1 Tax=Thioclava sp. ES.031 TaxID=1798203 RepID=UPI000C00984C|nr:hypothetical protein [Thioclava sp. ES.031]PFG64991.1 hypothetical protein AXZ77_3639 [Thioclava sp. ES.031]
MRGISGLAFAFGLALLAQPLAAQMMQGPKGGHGGGHGGGFAGGRMGHMHGADGTGHDEVTMPGLRGLNATPQESAELAVLFRNFPTLSREVDTLPNGIRTVTRSSNPVVMESLINHVTGMIARVEAKDDPQIFIQSPTLDIFFARAEGITTDIDMGEDGIIVTQTSEDPELVAALHKHAGEVSDMAARGMQAVHEMMMERAAN